MPMYAHYDREVDIAWFLFEQVAPGALVSEEQEWGLRDFDQASGKLVGLEFWRASERLPKELLDVLPAPQGALGSKLAKSQPAA